MRILKRRIATPNSPRSISGDLPSVKSGATSSNGGSGADIWSISTRSIIIGITIVLCLMIGQVYIFSHVTTVPSFFRFLRGLYYLNFAEKSPHIYSSSGGTHLITNRTTIDPLLKTKSSRSRCRIVPDYFDNIRTKDSENEMEGESTDDWSITHGQNMSLRCLPNFLFIGVSKCGTSSMRTHLVAHPGIRFVRRMQTGAEGAEVHRFDRWDFMFSNYFVEQALEWGHAPRVKNASSPVIHYTPHYLFDPAVPLRVKTFYHYGLKFLIMVRDPTTRAVSSYWFKRPNERGGSAKDFHKSVASEIKHRRRYERCIASYLLTTKEKAGWISKNAATWKAERKEWESHSSRSSSEKGSTSEVNHGEVTSESGKSSFEAWNLVGVWKAKGFTIGERVNAEKQCMFKSLKAEKEREVALFSKQVSKTNQVTEEKETTGDVATSLIGLSSLTGSVELKDIEVTEKHDDDLVNTEKEASHDVEAGGGVLMRQHVSKGLYVEQVDRWFNVFERKKFLIVELEAFKRDEVGTFNNICSFLGTPAVGRNAFPTVTALKAQLDKRYNEGRNPDSTPIPKRTLQLLDRFFKPYTLAFFDLIGQKFDSWHT